MNKYIVITTINNPSDAIKKFAEYKDWNLIVVGDKKTSSNWKWKNAHYISPDAQTKMDSKLVDSIPWNHYSRKMMGYLHAIYNNADIIADSDDDNVPFGDWGQIQNPTNIIKGSKFVNIYSYYTKHKIWPRGYPLELINQDGGQKLIKGGATVGIWQFLADISPDVDAIYRLVDGSDVNFKGNMFGAVDYGSYSPINSQNTFFTKEMFPLLYLPTTVSFRFTDILRGFVAQPIMWHSKYRLGFGPSTVKQYRNQHNLMHDFVDEISMYKDTKEIINVIEGVKMKASISQNLLLVYSALVENNLVHKDELVSVKKWIDDLKKGGIN